MYRNPPEWPLLLGGAGNSTPPASILEALMLYGGLTPQDQSERIDPEKLRRLPQRMPGNLHSGAKVGSATFWTPWSHLAPEVWTIFSVTMSAISIADD